MGNRVAVGLSGGVDSSAAVYLLKKENPDIAGFTLKLCLAGERCADKDNLYQIQSLCKKLDIPYYVIEAEKIFKEKIISYFVSSYLKGETPNPCAFCNRLIKFGLLWEKIKEQGFDYLATGHYACIEKKEGNFFFKKAKDKKKSQEYFLALVPKDILSHLYFPLGIYTKEEVKNIARTDKIIFEEKKESQDICFVKDRLYKNFIKEYLADTDRYRGGIKHINGRILGEHKGVYHFTYGQRQGLGISWREPLYVVDIDSENRTVIVGEKEYLYRDNFIVKDINWFISPRDLEDIEVRIRYNSLFYKCGVKIDKDKAKVFLKEKIAAVTPGQVAAFYHDDLVVAGGIIEKCKM